jgi:hypothetical protein
VTNVPASGANANQALAALRNGALQGAAVLIPLPSRGNLWVFEV